MPLDAPLPTEQNEFDALTGRMLTIYTNLQAAPETHVGLHTAALATSYAQATEYLRDHPELAHQYTELGSLALTADEGAITAQEASVRQLREYAEEGLLEEEAVAQAEHTIFLSRVALNNKANLAIYKKLFGSVEPEQTLTPSAQPASVQPPVPSAETEPKPRRARKPALPEVEEVDLGPNGEWRRLGAVEAARVGITDSETMQLLIGDDDLQRSVLRYAIACTEPDGFRIEHLRRDVPVIKAMDDKEYSRFKADFPRLQDEMVRVARTHKIFIKWEYEGERRGRSYWLEAGFKNSADTVVTQRRDQGAYAPSQDRDRTTTHRSRPRRGEAAVDKRATSSDIEYRRAASFTERLLQGIDQIITEGADDRSSRVKHVESQVTRRLDITVTQAEGLMQQLKEEGLLHKLNLAGSAHYSLHRRDESGVSEPARSHNRADHDRRPKREKEDLTITPEDCIVAEKVLNGLVDVAAGRRLAVDDLLPMIQQDLDVKITHRELVFLLDKLKFNGHVFIFPRDGKLLTAVTGRTKGLWENDPQLVLTELIEDQKRTV